MIMFLIYLYDTSSIVLHLEAGTPCSISYCKRFCIMTYTHIYFEIYDDDMNFNFRCFPYSIPNMCSRRWYTFILPRGRCWAVYGYRWT